MQTVEFLTAAARAGRYAALPLLLLCAAAVPTGCDSPTEVKKGALVRTVCEGNGIPGRYIFFWDGRDDDRKTVAAGSYQCFLEAENGDVYAIDLTALDGTRGIRADTLGTDTSYWLHIPTEPALYSLSPSIPEPFYNRDGTNIPFEISGTGYVRVRIHRKR
ncbi:hypothetical protein JW777_03550 [bacterium]|nr:hypothetical protein [bacterium]